MSVRVAIHDRVGGFSGRWMEYCSEQGIDHEVVDCYDTDIISNLREFNGLMWHMDHQRPVDLLMARNVLESADQMGLVVFPSHATCWHFDDKVAQKYLLEAVEAPLAPTHLFYDQAKAMEWLGATEYPVVAKLRRGAGSYNVKLLHNRGEAEAYCRKMFGRGASPVPQYFDDVATKIRNVRNLSALWEKARRMPSLIRRKRQTRRVMAREQGYVLFQKYMPDNDHDTRITVVGNRAWGYIRYVRKGDFRASGSGNASYDPANINPECVKIAFQVARALGSQSVALDYVENAKGTPYLTEISYGYVSSMVHACPGQWDPELNFHEGHLWPEHAHVQDLVAAIRSK